MKKIEKANKVIMTRKMNFKRFKEAFKAFVGYLDNFFYLILEAILEFFVFCFHLFIFLLDIIYDFIFFVVDILILFFKSLVPLYKNIKLTLIRLFGIFLFLLVKLYRMVEKVYKKVKDCFNNKK